MIVTGGGDSNESAAVAAGHIFLVGKTQHNSRSPYTTDKAYEPQADNHMPMGNVWNVTLPPEGHTEQRDGGIGLKKHRNI